MSINIFCITIFIMIQLNKLINNKNKMLKNIKTKIISAIIIVSYMFPYNTVFADFNYSKEIRAKIIENFKKQQYKNIYNKENLLLNENLNFFETQSKIWFFEIIKDKTADKTQDLSLQKEVFSSRVMNLEETINKIDQDIINIDIEINAINRKIVETVISINNTQSQIKELNRLIFENKKILLDYIAHIYKKSNIIVSDTDKWVDSIKTILLSEQNLWEVLSDIHFSSILDVTGQMLVEKHRALAKNLFVKKVSLEQDNKNMTILKEQEIQKKKESKEKKDFKIKILDYTKWKESLFQNYIEQNQEIEKNLKMKILENKIKLILQKKDVLKKYNCKYDSMIDSKIKDVDISDIEDAENTCDNLNKILKNESLLTPIEDWASNVFSWPVFPSDWLSAYYKDPSYQAQVWASHDAIDIKANQWTEIKAPLDWYITYLKSPTDSGYAYVALKHSNWYITVYWHVSEILFEKYDFIKAWTVFAKVWWEPGTNWAGPITSWPHLHLELFKDWQVIDPLDYLDLTDLWDEKLPQNDKYIYKFYSDFKNKFWFDYEWELKLKVSVFKLEWEDEVERQKYLLSTYASPDFNDWNIWIEESVDAWLDPSFVMCIWLAESWLWRNLKTRFNVWNVWNTDSGWTYSFESARNWIYWMTKTLNNKFLWGYNSINELSRYWNSDWAIYASSPFNWHNNLVRCLSALKWTQVPDDYKFRNIY